MTRLRGRCPKGQRLRFACPHGHWRTTTVIGAVRLDGTTAAMAIEGATDTEAVPEPSTYALLALGAAGLGAHLIRRRRR